MSLVWMAIVVTWVSMHLLLGMGRRQVDLLGMRIVRHVRLGHHRIAAGAWRLWAERLLHAGHVLLLLLLLQGAREGYSSTALPPKHSNYVSNGLIWQALDLSEDPPRYGSPTPLWGLCGSTVPKCGMNTNSTSVVEDGHGSDTALLLHPNSTGQHSWAFHFKDQLNETCHTKQ